MKKLTTFLLSTLMILTLGCAAAGTYTVDGYYTIEYPDTLLLDDTTYLDENNEWVKWMFLLEGENFVIDAYISVVEGLPGFTLYGADEDGVQIYIDEALRILDGQNPVVLEIITPESGVPFYVYHLEDDYGVYLYAETIINGMTVNFPAYHFDPSEAPDEVLLETLKTVVYSFTPVMEE